MAAPRAKPPSKPVQARTVTNRATTLSQCFCIITNKIVVNLLYLIVKNHVFADGNKRIAATLFIYFLNFYDILYKNGKQTIDNNTLTALTLLIAESNPKEKEVIIDLVMNFLNND